MLSRPSSPSHLGECKNGTCCGTSHHYDFAPSCVSQNPLLRWWVQSVVTTKPRREIVCTLYPLSPAFTGYLVMDTSAQCLAVNATPTVAPRSPLCPTDGLFCDAQCGRNYYECWNGQPTSLRPVRRCPLCPPRISSRPHPQFLVLIRSRRVPDATISEGQRCLSTTMMSAA